MFHDLRLRLRSLLRVSDPDRLVRITRGDQPVMRYDASLRARESTRLMAGLTASFPMESDIWVPVRTRPRLVSWFDSGRETRMMLLFGHE
jgi:hypothetical protein